VHFFPGLLDRGGAGTAIAEELLLLADLLLGRWQRVRDGTHSRRWWHRPIQGGLRAEV
jgi:hypothetical protein